MNVGELRTALEGLADDLPVILDNSVVGQYEHLRSLGLRHDVWTDDGTDDDYEGPALILDIP